MEPAEQKEPRVELEGGVLSEQAQLGPDRLKKPRTGSVQTGRLGPEWLKKPRAGSDEDRLARPDQTEIDQQGQISVSRKAVGKILPQGNIFQSQCKSSFMSIQVLTVLVSVLLKTCIKVFSEHIRCTKRHYFELVFFVFFLSLCLSASLSVSVHFLTLCIRFLSG